MAAKKIVRNKTHKGHKIIVRGPNRFGNYTLQLDRKISKWNWHDPDSAVYVAIATIEMGLVHRLR